MKQFVFFVEGSPITYSTNGEAKWRRMIASKVQERYPNAIVMDKAKANRFIITLRIYLRLGRLWKKNDVDNFAKPIIDTLFASGKQSPTGILFDVDDTFVVSVNIKKMAAISNREEARIYVTWFVDRS